MIKNKNIETNLKRGDFNYHLPHELIAQTPLEKRDDSRLFVLSRTDGDISHRMFRDIGDYLQEGDVLVINDSKVIPARLFGKKANTEVEIEILLLRQLEYDKWETIMRPGKRAKPGTDIILNDGRLCAKVIEITPDGGRIVQFNVGGAELYTLLDEIGNMPLPPYITEKLTDKTRYQTVYAHKEGSAAAPTAGLHFTPELLCEIKSNGIKIAPVMLHVGLGTFRPVKTDRISDHTMHSEYFEISDESAEIINNRKGRLIAVGTTSCRVIESVADGNGNVTALSGDTGIFIYPGYKFKAVDALITNFHLPESTLLMLVSAFSSRELVLNAYAEAIKERYRFFSFGDAMLLI